MRQSRRALLGTIATASLAGCTDVTSLTDTGGPDGNETNTGTDTDPDATTGGSGGDGLPAPARDVGTQFEGFEDPKHWYVLSNQGSATTTPENAYVGSKSLRLEASSSDAFAGVYKAFGEPKDLSGKNLSIAVRLNEPKIAKLSIALLAPDEGNMVRMTRTFPGPVGKWVRSNMGVTTVKGDPDLSEVREIRLVARRRGQDGAAIDMSVDDIRLVDEPEKGYVTLTFDDGPVSHYNKGFPAMQEYGFPGVAGIISDAVYEEDRIDIGMLREMSSAGWDVASHPYVGNKLLTEYSPDQQRKMIEDNKQFLEQKGFRDGARHFLTPKNMLGPETVEIVRDLHDTLYTFGGMPNSMPATTNYNFSRINAANTAPVKQYIDAADEYKQYLVLNTHAIGPGEGSIDESDFRAVLDYIDQANVEVVTCSDVLERQSQG